MRILLSEARKFSTLIELLLIRALRQEFTPPKLPPRSRAKSRCDICEPCLSARIMRKRTSALSLSSRFSGISKATASEVTVVICSGRNHQNALSCVEGRSKFAGFQVKNQRMENEFLNGSELQRSRLSCVRSEAHDLGVWPTMCAIPRGSVIPKRLTTFNSYCKDRSVQCSQVFPAHDLRCWIPWFDGASFLLD